METLSFGFHVGGTKEDIAADEGIFYEGSSSVSPDFLPTRAIIAWKDQVQAFFGN